VSSLVPFSDEFERAVIVAALQDPMLFPKISAVISSEDFFKDKHREIFKTMASLDVDNLDSLSVEDRLSEGTKEYFKTLVEDSDRILPSTANALFYAETVKSKSKLRAAIDLGREVAAIAYTPNVDAEEALQDIEDMFARFLRKKVEDNKSQTTVESFKDFLARLGTRATEEEGVKTGFKNLDYMLHRLEGLIILAGRPGMGKTAMAINIARNVAETKPVLLFSVEQTQEQIFERMLSAESEVNLEDIRTGAFIAVPGEVDRIKGAEERLLRLFERIHVDERADIPTNYIVSTARQKRYEWGEIGLIVVDYLHILRLNGKQTVDALGDAVKELRALGKELNCPVLLLSQLSRQPEKGFASDNKKAVNKRPELSDLRSSGEIEQSADVVIFLYRDSYYTNFITEKDVVEVIVKKHRNGRTGVISMTWLPQYVKYTD
jgi:replicative DNA helicase